MNNADLIGLLKAIAKGVHTPRSGLCETIIPFTESKSLSEAMSIVKKASMSWQYYSGTHTYPVPGLFKFMDPVMVYKRHYDNCSLYKGRQGRLRRDLARHIADCLETDDG